MRYRSHLSSDERAYARSFYAAFEALKAVLVRVAASTLIWHQDRDGAAAHLAALVQSAQELQGVQRSWAAGTADRTSPDVPDRATVALILQAIGQDIEGLRRASVEDDATHAHGFLQHLLAHHARLRQAALALWPLELMSEAGALAGPHPQHDEG